MMEEKEIKDIQNKAFEFAQNICDVLNDNLQQLKEIAPKLITAECALLFSLYDGKQYNSTDQEIIKQIKQSMRNCSKEFAIIPEKMLDFKFNEIWGKAKIKNVENVLFRWLINSVCKGIFAEGDILSYIIIKNERFQLLKDTEKLISKHIQNKQVKANLKNE